MKANKLCLVTGASGGIGRAISHELAHAGYTVILQGRAHEKLADIQKELKHSSHIVLGDLTDEDDRTQILNESFKYGDIDLLVNNAGVSCFSSFTGSDKAALVDLMDVNLLSPMLFTHEFLNRLNTVNNNTDRKNTKKIETTIINIGSTFGSIGYPGFSLYCASKFGLRGFTESLSRELTNSNVRVAYFAPRATNTSINSTKVDEMNKALGNTSDSPEFVAKQFMVLLNSNKTRKFVGWSEKIFVRLNGAFPEVVDKAIGSKMRKIEQFINQEKNVNPTSNVSLAEEK